MQAFVTDDLWLPRLSSDRTRSNGENGSRGLGHVSNAKLLRLHGIETRHPLEVVNFTDEEGGLTGSRAMVGKLTEEAPVYLIESNSDVYPMKLLHVEVDATVRTPRGPIPIASAIDAYAFPK